MRTAEFLWQEGHTAHATKEEALEEAKQDGEGVCRFAQNWMAVPVIMGSKSESRAVWQVPWKPLRLKR